MAYDPNNYINGVDQRTVAQQRKDEKADAKKSAAKLKEGMRKRILNVKTKSPSATDVQTGNVRGAVKLNKSKTTSKETKVATIKSKAQVLKERAEAAKKKPTPIKPKTPKAPAMPKKPKPAVGADVAARKKYGPNSHNNGYTN